MNIIKRMAEIKARKAELRSLLESGDQVDLDAIEKELRELDEENANLEKRQQTINGINDGSVPANVIPNPVAARSDDDEKREKEYRTAFFKNLMGRNLNEAERRAIDSSDVPGAIPTQTANEIIRKLKQIVPLLSEVTLLHIAGNVTFAVENTKNEAALHTENASISASDDDLVSVTLGGYEIVKLIRISATVRTMSINSFESWLVDMLTEALAEKVEDYLVNGTGSSQPKGVAYARTWTDDVSGIAWAGASLANVDITEGIALLPGGYDRNAKFLMSKKTFWANVMPIRDDSKAPIVKEDGKGGYLIHGYPVMMSDKVANGVIFLGDYKKIVANLAENFNVKASEHSGFAYNAVDYRGTCIFDSDVAVGEAFVKIAASL
jgi:HK97 family phage major capsid protein